MEERKKELEVLAAGIRLVTLQIFRSFGAGHVGGAMSIVETLAALYGSELRCDAGNPEWPERDRLVMSKGHAGPALYAALSLRGFFPKEMLQELNRGGGRLPSHCDRTKTPGVDMTTGSLGQGASLAAGVALGARLNGWDNYTYLILGDGECDEGQVWESAAFAAHYKLSRLIAFVDLNKQQLDGYTDDVLFKGDIGEKFRAFGWNVLECYGHDPAAIRDTIVSAKSEQTRPSVIILDTVKGYGCAFAEGKESNHHMNFSKEQIDEAILEAGAALEFARSN